MNDAQGAVLVCVGVLGLGWLIGGWVGVLVGVCVLAYLAALG